MRLRLRDQQDDYNMVLRQLEEVDQKPNVLSSKNTGSSLEKRQTQLENNIEIKSRLEVTLPEEANKADTDS